MSITNGHTSWPWIFLTFHIIISSSNWFSISSFSKFCSSNSDIKLLFAILWSWIMSSNCSNACLLLAADFLCLNLSWVCLFQNVSSLHILKEVLNLKYLFNDRSFFVGDSLCSIIFACYIDNLLDNSSLLFISSLILYERCCLHYSS